MCVRCSRRVSCSLKHNHHFPLSLPPSSLSLSPKLIHPQCCHPAVLLISSYSLLLSLPISCFYKHKEHIVSASIKVNPFSLAVARPSLRWIWAGLPLFSSWHRGGPESRFVATRWVGESESSWHVALGFIHPVCRSASFLFWLISQSVTPVHLVRNTHKSTRWGGWVVTLFSQQRITKCNSINFGELHQRRKTFKDIKFLSKLYKCVT